MVQRTGSITEEISVRFNIDNVIIKTDHSLISVSYRQAEILIGKLVSLKEQRQAALDVKIAEVARMQ